MKTSLNSITIEALKSISKQSIIDQHIRGVIFEKLVETPVVIRKKKERPELQLRDETPHLFSTGN